MMPSAFICERKLGQPRSRDVDLRTHLQGLLEELLDFLGIVVGARRDEVVARETNVGGFERRETLVEELATAAEGKAEEALHGADQSVWACVSRSGLFELTSPLRYMRSKA